MKKMLEISLVIIFIYSAIVTVLYINTNSNLKETNNMLKEINEKYNTITNIEAPPTLLTFYAQIEDIDLGNNTILVKGLDFDTVYKKKYLLKISDETWLIGNGNTGGSNLLTLSCFENNQYIAVTYYGVIDISTDYDIIEKIDKIQLLEERNK
jgi:hypothetical protein